LPRQSIYLAQLIRHDCNDALARIELLLSKLEEEESYNAIIITAELTEVSVEMQGMLRATERIE
jgi:hypothetical protein